jgi:hypothetical protein
MISHLLHEVTTHQYLRQQLAEKFPDVDEETLLDTLEGLTNLNEMLAAVVRSQLDDASLVQALRGRMDHMQERLGRLKTRVEKKKELVTTVMERANLKKITESDFTLSLRSTPRPLVVVDEKEIPERFWNPQPAKLDRRGLIEALKAGQTVEGATLGNGGVTISIRTK